MRRFNCALSMKMLTILFLVTLTYCDAAIYQLTDEEYARMPPVFHLDHFESCKRDANALFCISEFALVSDKPSPLLGMIQQYSEHQVTHYNHSKLRHGICVTQTCQKFYNSENRDLRFALEACLNESVSAKYDLKVKLLENPLCRNPNKAKEIDGLDIIVGVIGIVILIIDIVGTLVDFYCKKEQENRALRFLRCFSLVHNWRKLTSTVEDSKDHIISLRSLHGIKVILTLLVIITHTGAILVAAPAQPQAIEKMYVTSIFHIPMNTPLIMPVYFILSIFLLIYQLMLRTEKEQISWAMVKRRVILRWLRLTPAYAFALALTSTWFAHLTSGPIWSKCMEVEMNDCRRYWWQNMLYINNFFQNSVCMGPTWSQPVDFQLYCLALIVFWSCRTPLSRKIILSLLFIGGMFIPAVLIYVKDLDGIQLLTPEGVISIFIEDEHFKNIYSQSYANTGACAIGIAMGYLVYHWQKKQVDIKKYQTPIYRIIYWSLYFILLYCAYIGGIFFYDGPRHPLYVRVLFGAFHNLIFALLSTVLIVGCIFKFEDYYRGFLEWRGFQIASHLTYSAYLTHWTLVINYLSSQTSLTEINGWVAAKIFAVILAGSFIVALCFWFLVAAPFNNVIDEFTSNSKSSEIKKKVK